MNLTENLPSAEKILIVIPCLNEEATIARLVTYLLQDTQNLSARIVIADGDSRDRTAQIAQHLAERNPSVAFLPNPQRLQSAAVNLAVDRFGLDSDYLIRIDAHADYPQGYCAALLEEAKRRQADSVVVAMNSLGKPGFQRAVAAAQNSKLGNGGSAHRMAGGKGKWVDHGHHALIRMEAFKAVSGYDPAFSHNEDAELDVRLRQAGYRIWLTAKVSLDYYPRSSPLALLRQYKHYGNGRLRTLLKHRIRPRLRQIAPVAVIPAVLLAFIAPMFWPALLPLLLWCILCLAYGAWLGIKNKKADICMAGPAAMIMHFGWSAGFWQRFFTGPWRSAP